MSITRKQLIITGIAGTTIWPLMIAAGIALSRATTPEAEVAAAPRRTPPVYVVNPHCADLGVREILESVRRQGQGVTCDPGLRPAALSAPRP